MPGLRPSPRARRPRRPLRSSRVSHLERLEPRQLLDGAASVVISEFLASNSGGLRDQDGASSDWIELYNPGDQPVDLGGWYLTDDADEPDKWRFPSTVIGAGSYLVVFASNKNRATSGSELHTNFALSANGEYLGLVRPDLTVADAFDPEFPAQRGNVSYGHPIDTTRLVSPGASADVDVPGDGSLGLSWTDPAFVPGAGWTNGPTGVGFGVAQPGFLVSYYEANVTVDDLSIAYSVIARPDLRRRTAVEPADAINYLNTGSSAHFGDDRPFPTQTLNEDVDDFVIDARGIVTIPTAGTWTFGVNSDDGFELILERPGQSPISLAFPGQRGPDDTIQAVNIPEAGAWNARLVFYERGGGSGVELFAAPGAHAVFDSAMALVGDTASGGLPVFHTGDSLNGPILGTDVGASMLGVNASALVRIPFEVDDPALFQTLLLRMRYDDGFVAYLNGVEVARRNAPGVVSWDSKATASREGFDILDPETFGLTRYLGLLQAGTNVLAIQGLNSDPGDDDFLVLPELLGVTVHPAEGRYFATPTPGDANGTPYLGFIGQVTASVPRGFYDAAFSVELASATPGVRIRYTLDGSEPTESNGLDYDGPLAIDRTTTLRASVFLPGYLSPPSETYTYLFLSDVVAQSADGSPPPGWPSSWGNNVVDYGMDPDIVDDPRFGGQAMIDALEALPSISLTTGLGNLFDPVTGIYANAYNQGRDWERPASVELINPDGSPGFQINAGVRIRGGFSRSGGNPKHSFRLFFRDEYEGDLEFPLFGDEGADVFEKVDLRTAQNYSWSFLGDPLYTFTRDIFSRDTQRDMGEPYTRGRYYHLYIDGQYWGLYQTQERSEAFYGETYFGGDEDDYDVVKVEAGPYVIQATDGTLDAWQRLWEAATAGFASDAAYLKAQGKNADGTDNANYEVLLDVDNLIDYMLVIFYGGNLDAPISAFLGNGAPNNFYALRNRKAREGFRFFAHDSEHTLLNAFEDRTGPYPAGEQFPHFNPQWLHQQLMANAEYRLRFADHVRRHFFDGGALTPEAATARFLARVGEVGPAILGESARWGDAKVSTPYTIDTWQAAVDSILQNFFPARTAIVLDQLRADGLYPSVEAPGILVNGVPSRGGRVAAGSVLRFAVTSGLVYYTTDGTDPRLPGGGIRPTALVYDPATDTITLDATTTITARALDGGAWSAIDSAAFQVNVPAGADNLAITEVEYNPHAPAKGSGELDVDKDDYEFIELRNIGPREIDLTDVRFTTGITFDFTGSGVTTLAPGAYVVLVKNPDAFRSRYGNSATIVGPYSGNLSNGGERITLIDASGAVIRDFTYDDAAPWPTSPDGGGTTLNVLDVAGDLNDPANWRVSADRGGSPGFAGNTAPIIAGLADAATDEDVATAPLPFTVDDAETATGSLIVTAASDNPALIPLVGLVLAGTGGDRTLTITPAADQFGSATITITVDDGHGGLASASFVLTVRPVNDVPSALDHDFAIDEDATLDLAGPGLLEGASDPDGDPLTAALADLPDHGTVDVRPDGSFTYTPAPNYHGEDSFTYTVDDGTATSAPAKVLIIIVSVPDAPEVPPIDVIAATEGDSLSFLITANDPDGPADRLTFALDPGAPSGARIDAETGRFSWTLTELDGPGTFSIAVRVADSSVPALSTVRTFVITVAESNRAPVFDPIDDLSALEGSLVTFTAHANDPDLPAHHLTYSLAPGAPDGMTIDPETGLVSWTAAASRDRPFRITVHAADDGSPSLAEAITVSIRVANVAPTVTAGPDATTSQGVPMIREGSFNDPGTGTWTATVDYGDGGGPQPLALNPDKTFRLEHTYASAGTFRVTVTVTDGDGGVGTSRFEVRARDVIAPRVADVRAIRSRRGFTSLVVGFNEPMPSDLADLLPTYRVVSAGRDRRFGTRDDVVIRLRPAAFDPATGLLTLTPRRPLPTRQPYQLTIPDTGFADTSGNRLDGDADGRPGGDAVVRFGATPRQAVTARVVDWISAAGELPGVRSSRRPRRSPRR